jgi:hypothetical protein
MQREIKFRAWHLGHKRIFTGNEVVSICFKSNHVLLYDQYGWTTLATLDLMQFTGLHDKNGKEIYEGDVMKDRFGAISQIVFVNELASYRQLSKIGYSPLSQNSIISDNDLVIGNIYENPELIA